MIGPFPLIFSSNQLKINIEVDIAWDGNRDSILPLPS